VICPKCQKNYLCIKVLEENKESNFRRLILYQAFPTENGIRFVVDIL